MSPGTIRLHTQKPPLLSPQPDPWAPWPEAFRFPGHALVGGGLQRVSFYLRPDS